MQEPQRRHRPIELIGKERGWKPKIGGNRQMQIKPELPHRVEIIECGVAKARRSRPRIDAAKRLARDNLGIGIRQIETDIESFLEIRLSEIEAFAGDADIAAIMPRPHDREFILVGRRCGKKRGSTREHCRHQGSRDTMIAHVEEAYLTACASEFRGDSPHRGRSRPSHVPRGACRAWPG